MVDVAARLKAEWRNETEKKFFTVEKTDAVLENCKPVEPR